MNYQHYGRKEEILTNHQIDVLRNKIKQLTKYYTKMANNVKKQLVTCESLREEIVNLINEAEDEGLSKGISNRLIDKLERPYALNLIYIKSRRQNKEYD